MSQAPVLITPKSYEALRREIKKFMKFERDVRDLSVCLTLNLDLASDEYDEFVSSCHGAYCLALNTNAPRNVDVVFGRVTESSVRVVGLTGPGEACAKFSGIVQTTAYPHLHTIQVSDVALLRYFVRSKRVTRIVVTNAESLRGVSFKPFGALRHLEIGVEKYKDACEPFAEAASIETIESIRVRGCLTDRGTAFWSRKCSKSLQSVSVTLAKSGTCREFFEFIADVPTVRFECDIDSRFPKRANKWEESFQIMRAKHLTFERPTFLDGTHSIVKAIETIARGLPNTVQTISLYVDDDVEFHVSAPYVVLRSHRWTKRMVDAAMRCKCESLELVDYTGWIEDGWVPDAPHVIWNRLCGSRD